MRKEYCIFEEAKKCNDCGQCDICDLNSSKKCNNCGKCLEMEGIDTKAVKIASVIEDEKDAEILQSVAYSEIEEDLELDEEEAVEDELDYEEEEESSLDEIDSQYFDDIEDEFGIKDDELEYIDDVDGLNEILEDEDRLKELTEEVYPGVYRIRKI